MKQKIPNEVIELLKPFEMSDKYFEAETVAITIRKFIAKNADLPQEVLLFLEAEHLAFNFVDKYSREGNNWENYFEPRPIDIYRKLISDRVTKDIKVTPETIEYWQKRYMETKNPILHARYSDLIWSFSKNFIDDRTRITFVRAAIDSYLEIFKRNLFANHFEVEYRLKRALHLALSINDIKRVRKVRNAFFDLFELAADISSPGTWGFLFDNVYGDKKIPLTKQQEKKIIVSLENFLYKTTDHDAKKKFAPWSAKTAVERLIKHYRRKNKTKEIHRVLRRYGHAFEEIAQKADPLLAMAWLQPVFDLYKSEGLRKDAQHIQLILKAKGKQSYKSMKTIKSKTEIDRKQMEHYLTALTQGGLTKSLTRLVFKFIPKIKEAQEELKELDKKSPILLRTSLTKIADDQIASTVGPIESDIEGHLIVQIAQNISLNELLLSFVIDKIVKRYKLTVNKLAKFIYKSPVFEIENRKLVEKGVQYYLSEDYIGATHVIVPQIENAVRKLLALLGQPTNKLGSQPGTMQEKNFNDILAEPVIKRIFPQDILTYYKTFLSDPRGFNIRNRLSHGLMKANDFTCFNADRVLHILLSLALIRKNS